MMTEYPKIETLYVRDTEGTKKMIEGHFRNPAVEYLKNNEWIFTEKIDGTNTRIYWDGHNLHFGGRTDKASIPATLIDYLQKNFLNLETEELCEQLFGEKEVIFYGEGYGKGIQKGGSYRKDVSFILFDITINGFWLNRKDVESIAKSFGMDCVPIIMKGTLEEAAAYIKTAPKSTIGTAPMEGVVGKPPVELFDKQGNRLVVKIKVKDFT